MLLLCLLACTLKDGRAGRVDGTLGDDSAGATTPADTSPPPAPTTTCVEGATMTFSPSPVPAAAPITITITAETAYVWVGLSVEGGETAVIGTVEQVGWSPSVWSAAVEGLPVGDWEVTFSADSGATIVCTAALPVYG